MTSPNKNDSTASQIKFFRNRYHIRTTFHGLKYVVSSRHLLEKIMWVLCLLGFTLCAWYLAIQTVERYFINPVVISIERDKFSWTTPLPAVTICPLDSVDQEKLDVMVKIFKPKNESSLRAFLISLFFLNVTNLSAILEDDVVDSDAYLTSLVNLQTKPVAEVTVSGQWLNAKEWLHQVITEIGICYSFNSHLAPYFSPKYWNDRKWDILPEAQIFDLHPLDGEGFAHIANLTTSFNIYFHGAYEVPDVRRKPIFVPNGTLMQVYFKALRIFSNDDTKRLTVSQRKCRFYHESGLTHFPIYSYMVCRMECRIRLSLQLCGCVPHFYRKQHFEKTCNAAGLLCLSKHQDQLISLDDSESNCLCEPNCEEINYIPDEVDSRAWFLGSNLQYGLKNFPEMRFKRGVIFRFSDLLVYLGGVFGLFLGCSVLSVIELIYYFTVDVCCFVYKKQFN